MIHKLLTLILFSSFFFNAVKAQGLCDSTLVVCDSVTIDSIFITDFPQTGPRLHFSMTSGHTFLHGPVFTICPSDSTVEFESNHHPFSGIAGPIPVSTFYEFLNFNEVQDTLRGYIVVDNTNNPMPSCAIPFQVAVNNGPTNVKDDITASDILVYPNPAHNTISIVLANHSLTGAGIQLFDLMGRKQKINYTSSSINISQVPSGIYVLQIEIDNTVNLTKKLIIQ